VPSFAVGTPFVPYDMLAMVHKGERITPAAENARSIGSPINVSVTVIAKDLRSFQGRDTETQLTNQMQRIMKNAAVRVS
jgi:hypothetical protein